MNKRRSLLLLCALTTMLGAMRFAAAEPVNQVITLEAGWNAVFFEVEPSNTDPAVVFAGLEGEENLLSVWTWNPNAGTVEFIQNPTQLIPSSPQMLNYKPDDPEKIVTNLYAIHGNQAYLINVSSDATLTVTGEPKVPNTNWKPNSFNLVGFHVDAVSPPFFNTFFGPSSAHNGSLIGRDTPEFYRLDNPTASWVEVNKDDKYMAIRMKKGEAFWVYTQGSSEFNGPVAVQLERADGLHYGDTLTRQDVVFKNDSDVQQTISMSLSEGAPSSRLFYWKLNEASNIFEWVAFPPADLAIAPGESQRLSLGVKRDGLTSADSLTGNINVDADGTVFQIPLSLEGIDVAGLWVGQAVVNKVSEVQSESTDTTATGSAFSFRIIVHVDDTGQARLLSHVIQMWDKGAEADEKSDPPVVKREAGPVLFTDDGLMPNYTGTTMRDGKTVGRRISAPAFHHFGQSEPMGGNFGIQAGVLTTELNLSATDPTNPFNHLYHPDHLVESATFDIKREITLTFQDQDADGNNIVGSNGLGWGSLDMGGIYQETINGIHKKEITVKGTFLLHRVSKVSKVSKKESLQQ
jgi:hypothetical protein